MKPSAEKMVSEAVGGETMPKVFHYAPVKQLRNLQVNEDADCGSCALANRVIVAGDEDMILCRAALYDARTLACYVPGSDFQLVRKDGVEEWVKE